MNTSSLSDAVGRTDTRALEMITGKAFEEAFALAKEEAYELIEEEFESMFCGWNPLPIFTLMKGD